MTDMLCLLYSKWPQTSRLRRWNMSQNGVMTVWTANRKACVRLSAIALPDEAGAGAGRQAFGWWWNGLRNEHRWVLLDVLTKSCAIRTIRHTRTTKTFKSKRMVGEGCSPHLRFCLLNTCKGHNPNQEEGIQKMRAKAASNTSKRTEESPLGPEAQHGHSHW